MFTALELRQQIAFALDAEGSDHYLDDVDYIPAINAAIKWLTSVINSAYGQNKITEEFFREITYSAVFRTSNLSRVSLNVFPNEVWTILSVYVNPNYEIDTTLPQVNTPNDGESYYLSNLIHASSKFSCKRLNIEEWATNVDNPFEAGFEADYVCDDFKRYAFLNPINYRNTYSGTLSQEIEIRPAIKNEKVSIFWVRKPQEIISINDEIGFPSSVFQLLFNKALYYISFKQGDGTNINSVSSNDIQQLLQII